MVENHWCNLIRLAGESPQMADEEVLTVVSGQAIR